MVFSSTMFIFCFLPIVLAAYHIVPPQAKNVMLLLVSIFFYAWGEPVYVVLLLFSCAFNYLAGLGIEKGGKRQLIAAVVVNLLILGFFKYWGFFWGSLDSIPGITIPYHELPLPIGISFFTFQALSYVVDVYRGTVKAQRNIINFSLYISMFPQLVAGPIVKYKDIEEQLAQRTVTLNGFGQGVERFIIGLAKKVLLANGLGAIYTQINVLGFDNISLVTAWIGIICYTLQIYFDFSGYSDMAIGLGRMFGFTFMENFDHPYISKSITEFWRRWHISLSTWFKEYLYIPLGGNRVSTAKHVRNIMVVWMLTGLWHGAAWNFVAWGGYYGVLLLAEKYLLKDYLLKMPRIAQNFYTMFFVIIGWVLFSQPNLTSALSYLAAMFGAGAGIIDGTAIYMLRISFVLIVVGVISSTYWPHNWIISLRQKFPVLWGVAIAAALVLCTAFLVYDSYNPFLYFRF